MELINKDSNLKPDDSKAFITAASIHGFAAVLFNKLSQYWVAMLFSGHTVNLH